MTRPFKPNVAFLEKVRDRQVYKWFARGCYGFLGGQVTHSKHVAEGYVTRGAAASPGYRGFVELTDKGRAFLAGLGIPSEPAE